jgi:hypothetical protein
MQNRRGAQSNSKTGILGVRRAHPKKSLSKPWVATIVVKRKTIHLGYFETTDQASKAYLAAKTLHHPFQTLVQLGD